MKTEEKGSDVNLATYLLLDAFQGACDTAVVVSNDSDLAEPVKVARQVAGIKVGLVNPHPKGKRTKHLTGDFYRQVRPHLLASNQLPIEVADSSGRKIQKPSAW